MQPRIYTYKITFEEVPYYYYGVHKERKYNETYWGSPITNKWCWEFYTPKKQILEVFEYSDEGRMEAHNVEQRLIKPFYNTDKWCLNANCAGMISLEVARKIGTKLYEERRGVHSFTVEERRQIGRKTYESGKGCFSVPLERKIEIGRKMYEEKIGCFSVPPEVRVEISKKLCAEKRGIYSLTDEQKFERSSRAGKNTSSQKWMCEETGYVTNAGALTVYQGNRGIDTSKRKRIE
jgi:hypothetical protein